MTVAERFSADLDAFYEERKRQAYVCCRKDLELQWNERGRAFFDLRETHCRSCGLIWLRDPATHQWGPA